MDKLQLTGRNLGRVFNLRSSHLHAAHLWCYQVKLPNSKLKAQPKLLLGSLPIDPPHGALYEMLQQHNTIISMKP